MKNFHKESSGILGATERPQVATGEAPNPGSVPGGIRPLRPRPAGAGNEPRLPFNGRTFERKLEVKGSPATAGTHTFTESLILAQDERWRRA